jgi:alanine racemase
MGRTASTTEAVDFLAAVDAPGLRVGSVYTHFPTRTPATRVTRQQVRASRGGARADARRTHAAARPRRELGGDPADRESRLGLVRPGLAAYGLVPAEGSDPGLVPAMSFKSRLVQVRKVRAGRPVSYGRTFKTERESLIGVVPVGYGHGYSWLCSNRGAMLVAGRRVPIVGRVTMDLTTLT